MAADAVLAAAADDATTARADDAASLDGKPSDKLITHLNHAKNFTLDVTKCGARELYTELISAGLSDLLPQKKDGSGPYALGGCGGLRGIVAHANAVVAERRGARARSLAPVAPVAPPARLTDGEKWTIAAQKDWQRRVDKQKALGVDATDEQLRTWLTTEFNEYLVSYYMMRHDPEFLRRCLVEAGLCGEEFDVAEPFEAAVALRLQKQTRLACVVVSQDNGNRKARMSEVDRSLRNAQRRSTASPLRPHRQAVVAAEYAASASPAAATAVSRAEHGLFADTTTASCPLEAAFARPADSAPPPPPPPKTSSVARHWLPRGLLDQLASLPTVCKQGIMSLFGCGAKDARRLAKREQARRGRETKKKAQKKKAKKKKKRK